MLMRLTVLAAAAVAAVAGFVFIAAVPAEAQNASIRSQFCQNAYRELATKPRPRAMAISRDGTKCHSVWGGNVNQRQTDLNALTGCARSGQACRVVRR